MVHCFLFRHSTEGDVLVHCFLLHYSTKECAVGVDAEVHCFLFRHNTKESAVGVDAEVHCFLLEYGNTLSFSLADSSSVGREVEKGHTEKYETNNKDKGDTR